MNGQSDLRYTGRLGKNKANSKVVCAHSAVRVRVYRTAFYFFVMFGLFVCLFLVVVL